jgi:protein-tyrosine-phosphatase
MTTLTHPPLGLKLLAHDIRWRLIQALAHSDRRGRELVRILRQPQNLVSYHLKQLARQKLVSEHRSAADGRDVYFSLQLQQVSRLLSESGRAIHPGLGDAEHSAGAVSDPDSAAADPSVPSARVLFLCTHNSARSQMAEGILRHLSRGRVEVFSAGTEPGHIHPVAVQVMQQRGISLEGQRSKHLSEFTGQRFNYVITVCDLARETCPIFPGKPEQIHWSFPDPSAVAKGAAQLEAFERIATELTTRISFLLLLIQRQHRGDLPNGEA